MNKHIEIVKKWLADKSSVSLEELQANKKAAYAVYAAANSAAAEAAYIACAYASDASAYADYAAVYAAKAAYWVRRYEGLTK